MFSGYSTRNSGNICWMCRGNCRSASMRAASMSAIQVARRAPGHADPIPRDRRKPRCCPHREGGVSALACPEMRESFNARGLPPRSRGAFFHSTRNIVYRRSAAEGPDIVVNQLNSRRQRSSGGHVRCSLLRLGIGCAQTRWRFVADHGGGGRMVRAAMAGVAGSVRAGR